MNSDLHDNGGSTPECVDHKDKITCRITKRLGHSMEHGQRNDYQLGTVTHLSTSHERAELRSPQLHVCQHNATCIYKQ